MENKRRYSGLLLSTRESRELLCNRVMSIRHFSTGSVNQA